MAEEVTSVTLISLLLVAVRYVALLGARALGLMRSLALRGWRRHLAELELTALGGWLVARNIDEVDDKSFRPTVVIAWFVALAFAVWFLRARTRLVVADFVDYRSGEPKRLPGVSSLLVVELARLYDLYQVVDQSRAVPDAVRGPQNISFEQLSLDDAEHDRNIITEQTLVLPAPIKAEDLSDVLVSVVSVEATVGVGPITVPIGALAALVGRLASGPRITGAVHSVGGALILTARTVGASTIDTWRVDGAATIGGAERAAPSQPEELLDELAVRIFTDLALDGSVKWRAAWAHVNGLRAYRECLRKKKDRRLRLEEAKSHFIDTIAEDDTFDLAHYNLGVVTTELGQHEAAEAAFLAAIDRNNQRWEPYYGLAQLYFTQGRYDEMLPLCGRMLLLRVHRAETYHLRALARRRRGDVRGAMQARRAAGRWSWLRLCGAALKGREPEVRRLAADSLRNLAGMRAYDAKERSPLRKALGYFVAQRELKQGGFLDLSDFELGKIYSARRKWRAAARHFARAVELSPRRPRFWIQLARAYAELRKNRGDALFASERALEQPSQITASGFDRLVEVHRHIDHQAGADRIIQLAEFERRRQEWTPAQPAHDELEQQLEALLDREAVWQIAQVCLELAQHYVALESRDRAERVATRLADKLHDLTTQHPPEVSRQDVYAVVAQTLHAAGRNEEALLRAEAAVVHNPLSCRARTALAEVHRSLDQLDQAEAAYRGALACSPDDAIITFRLGECLLRSALKCYDSDRRQSTLRDSIDHLNNAIALSEMGQATGQKTSGTAQAVDHGQVRYLLGHAFFELDDYEHAITNLRLSCTLGYEPMLARLRLGVAYLRTGALYAGERELERIIAEADLADRTGEERDRRIGPTGDELTLDEIVVWARIHLASSHVEREARLEATIDTLTEMRSAIEQFDETSRNGLLAAVADCEGWARFKTREIDPALTALIASVDLEPTPEAYLHLALVHANQALETTGPERQHHAARARGFARLARRMGLGRQQVELIDDALRRLPDETRDTADGAGATGNAAMAFNSGTGART
ncbi:hypothetical protein BH18ACT4_BH18ACT4_06410 [soil metagenome]